MPNQGQEIAESRERALVKILWPDSMALIFTEDGTLTPTAKVFAEIVWQAAERDTRERDAQLYTDLFVALEFAFRTMEEFEEHERRSVFTFAKEKIGKVIQRGRAHSWEGSNQWIAGRSNDIHF